MTVAEIQRALIARGYDLGKGGPSGKGDDGDAGPKTEAAIRAFQQANDLRVTGRADALTEGLLAQPGGSRPVLGVMHLSPVGAAVLIAREGKRLRAYKDSVGVWTIGVGHTSMAGPPQVTPGLVITSEDCDAIFARDVEKYARTVRDGLKVEVGQHAFDALVSICYNIGQGGFSKSSFLRKINGRASVEEIKAAILAWGKPPEIIPRRKGEADQFATPYAVRMPSARRGDKPISVKAVASTSKPANARKELPAEGEKQNSELISDDAKPEIPKPDEKPTTLADEIGRNIKKITGRA